MSRYDRLASPIKKKEKINWINGQIIWLLKNPKETQEPSGLMYKICHITEKFLFLKRLEEGIYNTAIFS